MKGFNSEVRRKGKVFFVQTQETPMHTCIESSVFLSGKLLTSRKTFYTQFLNSSDLEEKIQKLIEDQHYSLLNEIIEGKFDHYLPPEEQ